MLLLGFSKADVLLIVIAFLLAQNVNAQLNFVRSRCNTTSGNYTADSDYKKSLDLLLSDFSNKTSMSGYEGVASPDKVYGLFYCRGDLDIAACSTCIQAAAKRVVLDCPTEKNAVIWYPECTLHYYANNLDAFLEEDGNWVGQNSLDNVSDPTQFLIKLTIFMTPLINKTAYGSTSPSYATGDLNITRLETLHCLVQCSPFVTGDHCNQCLQKALAEVGFCCSGGSTWMMIFNPSCQMRYDFLAFSNLTHGSSPIPAPVSKNPPAPVSMNAPSGKNASYYLTRVLVPVAVTLLLAAGICFWQRGKLLKFITQQESGNVQRGMSGEHKTEGHVAESFSFVAMKKATGSFSEANRLGQGGFGAVYKGILQNGEEVAIKRLSKESRQGNKEFSTEVLIVAKLQHRNLVRLLGYCEEKKERLLVYEYVPNLSLDQILFDPSKSKNLDWRTRCSIVFGIARGLRYLHHESRLNIVHRDLKTSNILLDADMNPKIADFGLAKLISLDHTQGDTTKVAGTLGYMAPEYIFQGQFSTKSDVYSFGVILLEIVSGQKICKPNQSQNHEGLLQRVWRHWEEGNFEELLDPALRKDVAEVTKCIQIALLCVQHDASTRPAMQMVLSWLNNNSVNIPSPIRPAALAFDTSSTTSICNSSSNVIEFTKSSSITSKYD